MLVLYTSLGRPRLEYPVQFWSLGYKVNIELLQRTQRWETKIKRGLMMVVGEGWLNHITPPIPPPPRKKKKVYRFFEVPPVLTIRLSYSKMKQLYDKSKYKKTLISARTNR